MKLRLERPGLCVVAAVLAIVGGLLMWLGPIWVESMSMEGRAFFIIGDIIGLAWQMRLLAGAILFLAAILAVRSL